MLGEAMRALPLRVALLLCVAGAAPATATETALRFVRDGELQRSLDLETLRSRCDVETVVIERDPYYGRRKSFHACPLAQVLTLGFGPSPPRAAGGSFFLRARDGYERPASAERLAEAGAYLAFADADLTRGATPAWEPIDRRQLDPGPFYLVWSRAHQTDTHRYPWPYQLSRIEWAAFETRFPHTLPGGAGEDSEAWAGFAIFRRDCIACHAINGEGGKVGPDLNVPRSIVEYRPEEQIKAFVREPGAFRYTSMPANPQLGESDLDALIAYFREMAQRKHDPLRSAGRVGSAGGR